MVAGDLENRLAEALLQDGAVREAAVARAQPPRGGERRELVAAQVHPSLDRAVQLLPGCIDLRTLGEGTCMVGHPGSQPSRYRVCARFLGNCAYASSGSFVSRSTLAPWRAAASSMV